MSSFFTILSRSEGIYKEKGSRFLSYAFPIATEEEVRALLDSLRKEHPKARHICFAYKTGIKNEIVKFSDDGEPHNSAGTPILGQIKSFNLTNVLVAVVRYFGGIKLGVGGLTAAYREAAQATLVNAQIIEDIEREILDIEIDYDQFPELMNFVKQKNVRILDKKIDKICQLRIFGPTEYIREVEKIISKFQKLKIV